MIDTAAVRDAFPAPRTWPARILTVLVVGVVGGLGAVGLQSGLRACTHLFQNVLAGYPAPEVAAYGGHADALGGFHSVTRMWALPFVVALGMTIAVLVSRFADRPVAGTDGVIDAVNTGETDRLTWRTATAKLVATAATLGSGGSGGTEGPVAQVGASFAAALARRLRVDPGQVAVAAVAGLAAGVGALFRAPLGGALLGAELLRRRGLDLPLVLPCLFASFAGYAVFGAVLGYGPMFGHVSLGGFAGTRDLVPLLCVGVLCGLLARAYCVCFHGATRLLARLRAGGPTSSVSTAAGAGLLVGAAGLFVPEVLGTGYGTVQSELSAAVLLSAPLWLLCVLPLAKILATSATLGAGGVGGVFGPAMVIGGSAGALCWRASADFGLHPGSAPLYVVTGVAACLGPAVRAPLATAFLAAGLTGAQVPPLGLALAVLVALPLLGGEGLFPHQRKGARDEPRPPALRYGEKPLYQTYAKGDGRARAAVPGRTGGEGVPGQPTGGGAVAAAEVDDEVEAESSGIPDLTELPLEVLVDREDGALSRAIRLARSRRAGAGIVYAGFSNAAPAPARAQVELDDEPDS